MKVVFSSDDDRLARVYVAAFDDGSEVEFVESTQPPRSLEEKWVLIVSTLKGCPVGCPICDAGGDYQGKLTKDEILSQLDYLVEKRFPDRNVPVSMLKVQFARMGDPAFNDAVCEVLRELPSRYDTPMLVPSISTVAPVGREKFFNDLIRIKKEHYRAGRFQMQFSHPTADEALRRGLVPIRTMRFKEMAAFGGDFFESGDRKITLNFATAKGYPLDPEKLVGTFSPDRFIIKLTPINPTNAVKTSGLQGLIDPEDEAACRKTEAQFKKQGFDTILSIGELEENRIGSNCGMYLSKAKIKRP